MQKIALHSCLRNYKIEVSKIIDRGFQAQGITLPIKLKNEQLPINTLFADAPRKVVVNQKFHERRGRNHPAKSNLSYRNPSDILSLQMSR